MYSAIETKNYVINIISTLSTDDIEEGLASYIQDEEENCSSGYEDLFYVLLDEKLKRAEYEYTT